MEEEFVISKEKRQGILGHFAEIGFTNRLAIYLVLMLVFGLIGGFYLAIKSITYNYAGALLCYTVVFTPIGTACSIVLNSIVGKSKAENLSADGTGIKFATAQAENFGVDPNLFKDSPPC